jgi:hypothetical protein
MVIRMSDLTAATRHARRLLRWYPAAWRERYGDEFVDLMEQEVTDNPKSSGRTLNIAYKGASARLSELGVVGVTVNPRNQTTAVIASTFFVATAFLAIAVDTWSGAMLTWNLGRQASLPVTFGAGALTALTAVIALALIAIFGILTWLSARRIGQRQAKGLIGPWSLILVMMAFIIYSVHNALHFVIARGGIQWTNAGEAVKQLAGASSAVISTITRTWVHPGQQIKSFSDLVFAITPIALGLFAYGVARLTRKIGIPLSMNRLGHFVTFAISGSMTVFLACFVAWIAAGGDWLYSLGSVSQPYRFVEISAMAVIVAISILLLNHSRTPLAVPERSQNPHFD